MGKTPEKISENGKFQTYLARDRKLPRLLREKYEEYLKDRTENTRG